METGLTVLLLRLATNRLREPFSWTEADGQFQGGAWRYYANRVTGRRKAVLRPGLAGPLNGDFMRRGDLVKYPGSKALKHP
jgi:hypothetical protein